MGRVTGACTWSRLRDGSQVAASGCRHGSTWHCLHHHHHHWRPAALEPPHRALWSAQPVVDVLRTRDQPERARRRGFAMRALRSMDEHAWTRKIAGWTRTWSGNLVQPISSTSAPTCRQTGSRVDTPRSGNANPMHGATTRSTWRLTTRDSRMNAVSVSMRKVTSAGTARRRLMRCDATSGALCIGAHFFTRAPSPVARALGSGRGLPTTGTWSRPMQPVWQTAPIGAVE
mmetsp:Transcript_10019/g.32487  ORF Transcript_10019/g.32487 Transcript_10019/m.32487 type:complete len:230 (+) Transcript_10019:563-1252(+)